MLAHDPQVDPERAMSTDVSLLTTRTVAAQTDRGSRADDDPDDFLSSVTAVPVSSDLMSLTLTAPTDAEAVRRLSVLTSTYLDFRAEQLPLQSNVSWTACKQRIAELQPRSPSSRRASTSSRRPASSGASELSDAISQRTQVTGRSRRCSSPCRTPP